MKKIDQYYYKILDRICLIRAKSDFHGDLGLTNINKGCGYLLELFYYFRNQYDNLDQFLKNFANFEKMQSLKSFLAKVFIINK